MRTIYRRLWVPSRTFEYAFYLVIAYSLISPYLRIEVPLVAAGMTVALAGYCCVRLGAHVISVLAPIRWLLACTCSFVLIQVVVHGVPVTEQIVRTFTLWTCGAIILQCLCLRAGFLQRCTVVLIAIGAVAVPNLTIDNTGSVARAAAGIELGGNLRNANGLGGWFGFCFVSCAMLGLATRRQAHRALYWSVAAACLLIASLSVSRGVLLASAVAVVVGFRGLLKRGVFPLLLLVIIGAIVLESDLFEQTVSLYSARGLEDTGRLHLWPQVVRRIIADPLFGVGSFNISTYVPEQFVFVSTPHNSYLYFALAAGVIPFLFWLAFWLRIGWGAFVHRDSPNSSSFRLPFFLFLFIGSMLGDVGIDPWFLLACAVAAGPGAVMRRTRVDAAPAHARVRAPSNPIELAPSIRASRQTT